MDTPLAASIHKENVHVGGGKTTTMRKPINLKSAGKKRKALADYRDTYAPPCVSNEVDLKPKAHGKKHIAGVERQIVNRASKVPTLNTRSVSHGNFDMGNKPLNHLLSDEENKQCYEWAKEGIEGMDRYSWSIEDEENLYKKQTLSELMALAIGVSVSELEQPILSDDEGYKIDDPDMHSSVPFPGPFSSLYGPEELDDPLGVAGIVLDEYPLPEIKLEDD